MNKFSKWLKTFVFGEEEQTKKQQPSSGYIRAVTPNGKVEVTVHFDDNADFSNMKSDIMSLITHSFTEDIQ